MTSRRVALGLGIAIIGVACARRQQSVAASPGEPTFAENVAPILYENCAVCHRPGGLGPFSVLDYESTKANVDEMRDRVALKQMPPWHAEGARGVFKNDRRLTDADRNTILRWIDAGAKSGDLKRLPPAPSFPTSWTIGKPDLVVSMPEEFTVPASGMVEYQYFEVP
ncbi:MAG TPA: cytochrome c, partial [Gemmatimonadaceae bacterium]